MHTKGPWKVGRNEFPNEDNIYGPDNVIVGSAQQHRKEVKANARLIAAAPCLLEALEEIAKGEGVFSLDPKKHAYNTIANMKRIAEEAIRKAKSHADTLKGE